MRALALAAVLAVFAALSATGALGELSFTVIGDWGRRISYTDVIASRSVKEKSQFLLAIGDNFYKNPQSTSHGVTGLDDPKWKYIFEDQFHQPFFHKRWYVLAGNHDYDGNEMAQVEYTKKSNRWYFPSLYYKFNKKVAKGVSIDIIMLDTQVLSLENKDLKKYGRTKDVKQLKWLERTLKKSKATWKIVLGHHQIYYAKGANDWMKAKVVPLLEKYKVAAYINGHMHCFQHLKSPKIHYITAGNTAIQKPAETKGKGPKGLKIKYLHPTKDQFAGCGVDGCKGFITIKVKDKKKMTVKYFNSADKNLYSISITNPKR